MDPFSLLKILKLVSAIAGALSILCLISIILMVINHTPSQLKSIIEMEKRSKDPRYRKAVYVIAPDVQQKIDALLTAPDMSIFAGWQGHYPGKENTA